MAHNPWHIAAGLNHVGAYQVSGIPFAQGGIDATNATKVSFPYVTRWVYIVNTGASDVKVGFSELGVEGTEYFTVGKKDNQTYATSVRLELKVSELWFKDSDGAAIDVCAGLTSILPNKVSMGDGLASWSGSAGVG